MALLQNCYKGVGLWCYKRNNFTQNRLKIHNDCAQFTVKVNYVLLRKCVQN